jgi:hypothetical protein
MSEITISLSDAERCELECLIEHELDEMRQVFRRTEAPDFEEAQKKEEVLLRSLLAKLQQPTSAVV